MRKKQLCWWCMLLVVSGITLCACSPINTEFSCTLTANDRCLSIEQVDAMTRDADE